MTNEERRRMMDFILAQRAQFWASIQKLEKSQARHEESQRKAEMRISRNDFRADRLERILNLMIKAGQRARRQWRESDERWRESDERWNRRMAELRESQAYSDKRLDALIDIVRQQHSGSA